MFWNGGRGGIRYSRTPNLKSRYYADILWSIIRKSCKSLIGYDNPLSRTLSPWPTDIVLTGPRRWRAALGLKRNRLVVDFKRIVQTGKQLRPLWSWSRLEPCGQPSADRIGTTKRSRCTESHHGRVFRLASIAVQAVVGSIVWAFRRLKKPRCRNTCARGYALHSVCPQLSYFPFSSIAVVRSMREMRQFASIDLRRLRSAVFCHSSSRRQLRRMSESVRGPTRDGT